MSNGFELAGTPGYIVALPIRPPTTTAPLPTSTPSPPDPYKVATKFKAEKDVEEDYERRLREYETLSGRSQFETAVEAGLIGEGAQFVPSKVATYVPGIPVEVELTPATDWGYYTADQLAEQARQKSSYAVQLQEYGEKIRERKAVLAPLEPFKVDGGYGLVAAFGAGLGTDVYAAERLGLFPSREVSEAQFLQIKGSIRAGALEDLKPFRVGISFPYEGQRIPEMGYSLVGALGAGIPSLTLGLAGFTPKQVKEAEAALFTSPVAVGVESPGELSLPAFTEWYYRRNPEQDLRFPPIPRPGDYPLVRQTEGFFGIQTRPGYERALEEHEVEVARMKEARKSPDWISAETAYTREYGLGATLLTVPVEFAVAMTPPARVLRPEVSIGDIKWWEWGVLGGQVALTALAIAGPKLPFFRGPKIPTVRYGTVTEMGFPKPGHVKISLPYVREGPVPLEAVTGYTYYTPKGLWPVKVPGLTPVQAGMVPGEVGVATKFIWPGTPYTYVPSITAAVSGKLPPGLVLGGPKIPISPPLSLGPGLFRPSVLVAPPIIPTSGVAIAPTTLTMTRAQLAKLLGPFPTTVAVSPYTVPVVPSPTMFPRPPMVPSITPGVSPFVFPATEPVITPSVIPSITPIPGWSPSTIPGLVVPITELVPGKLPTPVYQLEPPLEPVLQPVPVPVLIPPKLITPPITSLIPPTEIPPKEITPPPPPPFLWLGAPRLGRGRVRRRRARRGRYERVMWPFPELVISMPAPFTGVRKRKVLRKKGEVPFGAKLPTARILKGVRM